MADTNNTKLDLANFPEKLRKARIAGGWTYESFAEEIGVSPRIVYDYESGVKHPRLETLVSIANALRVTVDSLLR